MLALENDEHYLAPEAWLQIMERDYLSSYIRQGGSSVKVVVADAAVRSRLRADLQTFATAGGYRFASVDSASRRVHLVHALFSEIAGQLPWDEIAHRYMVRILTEDHRKIPESGNLSVESLAEANDAAKGEIVQELRRLVSNRVYKDYALSREFRLAATAMSRATYDTGVDIQQQAKDARAWLTGSLDRIAAVRPLGLFRKIGRSNARQLLYSTTSWIRSSGDTGLVVVVDISRYALEKKEIETAEGFTYTKAAALDLNEVLRQFVDATDDLSSALIVFMTDERFLPGNTRGLNSYDALRLRLTDDVRDRRRPNPLAPMVRLKDTA